MSTSRIQTGLRLEESALKKITYIAQCEKRSLNAQIEILVENAIREFEKNNGVIQVEA